MEKGRSTSGGLIRISPTDTNLVLLLHVDEAKSSLRKDAHVLAWDNGQSSKFQSQLFLRCLNGKKTRPYTERHVIWTPARNQLLLEYTFMEVCKVTTPANVKMAILQRASRHVYELKQTVAVPSNTTTFLFRNDYMFRSIYFKFFVMVAW